MCVILRYTFYLLSLFMTLITTTVYNQTNFCDKIKILFVQNNTIKITIMYRYICIFILLYLHYYNGLYKTV